MAEAIESKADDIERNENIIQSFLIIIKNSTLQTSLREEKMSSTLAHSVNKIENCLANGPLDSAAGSLKTEVKGFLGFSKFDMIQ